MQYEEVTIHKVARRRQLFYIKTVSDMMQASLSESAITEAERLYSEAICQDDETAQSRLLAEARSVLHKALDGDPNNPSLYHMLGMCWYDEPEWSDKIRQAIEFHFKTAKQLAQSAHFPSLYLGHFYFDEWRYAEALPLFQQVDENYFEDIGQRWRILKNRELILCCHLYLNPGDIADSELEALCMVYEKADEEDRPVPREIVACVATLTNISQERKSAMARRITELIRSLEYENAFSARSDYESLIQSLL
jgi:tetratricopeptide (TPR) repeat protein